MPKTKKDAKAAAVAPTEVLAPEASPPVAAVETPPPTEPKPTAADKAADKAAEKFGEMIVRESSKGHALSVAFSNSVTENLQRVLGKKFTVTATGLSIQDGAKVTEAEAVRAVATLSESSEKASTIGTTTMLALGDLVLTIRAQLGDDVADKLIQQAVSITGKSKHTIQDAERVVKWANTVFEGHERPANLTPTHWQEAKNYAQDREGNPTIPAEEVRSILEVVATGKVVGKGVVDGQPVDQMKPLSCAEERDLLKKARGDTSPKPTPKGKKAKAKAAAAPQANDPASGGGDYLAPKGFLYIQDFDNIFHTEDLSEEALAAEDEGSSRFIVVDLEEMVILAPNGKPHKAIGDLPDLSIVVDELP